jgi:hypothetical protein
MLESRAAYLDRRNLYVAKIDIMKPCSAQVNIVKIGCG